MTMFDMPHCPTCKINVVTIDSICVVCKNHVQPYSIDKMSRDINDNTEEEE